jgi:hypothetical protein
MITLAGTVSAAFPLDKPMVAPAAGAGVVSVAVQLADAPPAMVAGLQESEDN